MTPNQSFAIALIMIGILFSTLNLKELRKRRISADRGILFAFIPMITWGLYFAFLKILVEKVGWFLPNYIGFLLFPLVFLYIKATGNKLEPFTKNKAFLPLFFSTILVRVAEYSYNLGISKGLVAVVAPIAGANPTLFVLLAFLIFKDPIKRQQIVGIIITLVGVVLLSVLSV